MYQEYDLDEYEDDGEEHEEEEAEEEYEEEKEEPKPTPEELQYLSLRQKLKESARKKLKKEYGASFGNSQLKQKTKLPYDNYGSFFGPSQPVIAQRVIQESKSLLENQHLTARTSNANHSNKNIPASSSSQARPAAREPTPAVVNEAKLKAQKLKHTRDYSCLFSSDAEFPAPKKEQPPRNVSAPNSAARPAQVPFKSKQSVGNHSKLVSNNHNERKVVSTNRPMQNKAAHPQVASGSKKPNMTSDDPRKRLGKSTVNGHNRPIGEKGMPSKVPAPSKVPVQNKISAPPMDRKVSVVGGKKVVPSVPRAPFPKLHSSVNKQHLEKRRELREPEKAKPTSKMPVSSSKPQIKPPKQNPPPRAPMPVVRPKKRPRGPFDDDDEMDAVAEIRKLFRYNPEKYDGVDDDDSDMEANFNDIQREELLSAKIGREEDEREAMLLEEEERQARVRREKRLKLKRQ